MKDFPCIFGKEIHQNCPVRMELNRIPEADIAKWIKPSSEVFGEAQKLMTVFVDILNTANKTLADFCRSCPYVKKA